MIGETDSWRCQRKTTKRFPRCSRSCWARPRSSTIWVQHFNGDVVSLFRLLSILIQEPVAPMSRQPPNYSIFRKSANDQIPNEIRVYFRKKIHHTFFKGLFQIPQTRPSECRIREEDVEFTSVLRRPISEHETLTILHSSIFNQILIFIMPAWF